MGAIIIAILAIDVRFRKNRHRLLASSYVDPVALKMRRGQGMAGLMPHEGGAKAARCEVLRPESSTGRRMCCSTPRATSIAGRAMAASSGCSRPHHDTSPVVARIGGRPLGLAFDQDGRIVVCVAGRGLVRVTTGGRERLLTDQTRRSLFSVQDDTTIRMADDLDIAPNGVIYFTDATKRYDIENLGARSAGGAPRTGRLLSYDPRSRRPAPNATISFSPTASASPMTASTCWWPAPGPARSWSLTSPTCPLARASSWTGCPGYPDNINRASDGGYWIALAGMRKPVFDQAMRYPRLRRRMTKRVPPTNWLFGNLNIGGVLKIDGAGKIVDAFWDASDGPLYMITSMREHKGALYLGGVTKRQNRPLAAPGRRSGTGAVPQAIGGINDAPRARAKSGSGHDPGGRAWPETAGSMMRRAWL
jgi:ribose transport system permease protein